MSTTEIQRFAADVKSNAALRAEAEKAYRQFSQAEPVDGLAAFAAGKGYGFTADELKAHAKPNARLDGKAVTDAELDGVAGGGNTFGGVASIFGSLFGTDPW